MKKLSPIVFGTSCLGNLYKAIPMETKVAIAAEWFKAFEHPVVDSAGKYGAGLSLECIGKALKALGKKNGDLTISVKLGWRKADPEKDGAAFADALVQLDGYRGQGGKNKLEIILEEPNPLFQVLPEAADGGGHDRKNRSGQSEIAQTGVQAGMSYYINNTMSIGPFAPHLGKIRGNYALA